MVTAVCTICFTTALYTLVTLQVGMVTAVCTICFTVRALMIELSTADPSDFELDRLRHPLLNIVYYTLVEIVPSALVLFILRKLPPKRNPVYQTDVEPNARV